MSRTIKSGKNTTLSRKTTHKPLKNPVIREKQTRLDILRNIAIETGLKKTDVESVFLTVKKLMRGHLKKKGSGEFLIPMTGIKIKRVQKKATKSRKMISPLTGQPVLVKAKPARPAIKVTALQSLKSVVEE